MTASLKLIKIGNSMGIVLPRDVIAKLRLELGDNLFLSEDRDGFRVRATDPAFVEAMTAAEQIMHEDRDILTVLAK